MKRLLIISNNVLSTTNNNGKTILSFIEGAEGLEVAQLYFSGELPRVRGYRYFQISDKDIIRGLVSPSKRGREKQATAAAADADDFSIRGRVGRNDLTLMIRDMLWNNKWESPVLKQWLEAFSPDAILFVAGDALFAYPICNAIRDKFQARLTVYVTDDYIMPRTGEPFLHRMRRERIRKYLESTVTRADCFYTISGLMHDEYLREMKAESFIAVNFPDDLFIPDRREPEQTVLTYTGSVYYGRAKILGEIAKILKRRNEQDPGTRAILRIYCNRTPDDEQMREMIIDGGSEYGGSLHREELKQTLNESTLLVFAESFEQEQIEKTKYSLSTKVPEYLSVGRPILAIGPEGIGSIEYLKDVSFCINDIRELEERILHVLASGQDFEEKGKAAREKYLKNHNKKEQQRAFLHHVTGEDEPE